MERQKKVVDASIGVKWFCYEEGTAEAISLFQQHTAGKIQLIVPALFFYELANALRYKKQQELTNGVLSLFLAQLLVIQPNLDIMERTVHLAQKYSLTVYDAAYLAISEVCQAKLITSDKQLLGLHHPLIESLVTKPS
ncbi:type II toxin-antitoxin system VapC family toxin [Candidatus Woesearchaeota archaeon]|nr:type II toxin-antitoxin system VapC family toxin [Candidatus Woesearchaeota archaeon]